MEEMFKPYNKEYMRMAILKHEETFKEQVYELHRLYRIQKLMMKNIARNRPANGRSQQLWKSKSQIKLDLEQPGEENYGDLEIIDETEIELTLGPSTYNQRKKPDTPLTSDSGPSFSSSSTGSSRILQGISKSSVDVEEQLRQQVPPWLFQVLSLNMT
ncbi:hypothetical protein HS088_TW13G01143 [Tripterygium wilfordii]|uniref:Uncharacterized protein n=1 Tax=Tripterygium wilfordii TaxID=458696 RepID=A0A7J7CVX1_TRIWF|nr:uncharacterized protein LOC120013947 [Tripterygium wilfordii]XP_038721863.1 uncharacterized protein LOC120013947 [Tripterygium wilfordii]KAF5738247.1 hypothetical protein HS088_TW13G01143 [Tripterygium wilfordii]